MVSNSIPIWTVADVAGRLAGKRAIVVGAGQMSWPSLSAAETRPDPPANAGQTPGETIGNGRAIALLFAREGAEVCCVDRVRDRAEDTVELIAAEGGIAWAHAADITDPAQADSIAAAAVGRWGGIDILVNNVGIGARGDGPAHRCEESAFERTLQVNLTGTWHSTKAVLPVMRAANAGSIVNISSLASLLGGHQLAYEVSKAAVNRLTLSTATANARYGVRCNAVLPGLMDTPMAVGGISEARGQSLEDTRRSRDAMIPLKGGMGSAWDTAYACCFLASDEAKFVTGVLLPVDGGMSARA